MSDRPAIRSNEHALLHPRRIVVFRDRYPNDFGAWMVWRGPRFISAHATHAEAITEAQRIARKWAGAAWTTPDGSTQAEYGLATT